ncbi:IclR family transcriptional regulator [Sciscionella sediminilitoris]|uniref:IclR family transcriptional regulator n=1 Tax=Sciscionella sediminilitoris TaxID=1445613 RepID=UPI00068EE4D9|nr:IclR family transcriptional regulator [Sciscionella sp. SE31]
MSASEPDSSSSAPSNRSVVRAARILRALGAGPAAMTVTEVAQQIGLPRATTFRLLVTLENEGFVDRQDTLYSLGWDLARLAGGIDPAAGLVPRVSGLIDELADEIGETVTLSVRRGRYDLDLVAQANPRRVGMAMSDMHGMKWSLHASSTGKLLLAELDDSELEAATSGELDKLTKHTITDYAELKQDLGRTRERGWSLTDEELEDGIVSVAVPIRDTAASLLAALTFVGPVYRIDTDKRTELTHRLLAGASRVQQHLNTTPADT